MIPPIRRNVHQHRCALAFGGFGRHNHARAAVGQRARTTSTSWSLCLAASTSADGRADAVSVDVLNAGLLVRGLIGQSPEAVGCTGITTVHVACEDDDTGSGAVREKLGELGALRVVRARGGGRGAGAQMGSAHVLVKTGRDAQPPSLLNAVLRRERMALGGDDRGLGEHRVAKAPPALRTDAPQRLAVVDHRRKAQVVAHPPGNPPRVASARLVESDRVRRHLADPSHRLPHHGGVVSLAVAAGQPGQAQIHLHQREGRVCIPRHNPGRQRRFRLGLARPRQSDPPGKSQDEYDAHRGSRQRHRTPRAAGTGTAVSEIHDSSTVPPVSE